MSETLNGFELCKKIETNNVQHQLAQKSMRAGAYVSKEEPNPNQAGLCVGQGIKSLWFIQRSKVHRWEHPEHDG